MLPQILDTLESATVHRRYGSVRRHPPPRERASGRDSWPPRHSVDCAREPVRTPYALPRTGPSRAAPIPSGSECPPTWDAVRLRIRRAPRPPCSVRASFPEAHSSGFPSPTHLDQMVHLKDNILHPGNRANGLFKPGHALDFLETIAGGVVALPNGKRANRSTQIHHCIRDPVFELGQIDAAANEDDSNLGVDLVIDY